MNSAVIEETGEIAPQKKNLFELGEELEKIFDLYDQVEGEVDEEVAAALERWFETASENLEDKLCAYRHMVSKFKKNRDWRLEEAKRIKALAERDDKNVDRLESRLMLFFEHTGNAKIETRLGAVRVQGNGGLKPLEFIKRELVKDENGNDVEKITVLEKEPDVKDLPDKYIKHVPEINNAAIRADLDAGIELDFAHLADRSKRVVWA
jgi:hypothetical protein